MNKMKRYAFKRAKKAAASSLHGKPFEAKAGHQYHYANLCGCGQPMTIAMAIFIDAEESNGVKPFISTISAQCKHCNRVMGLTAFPSAVAARTFLEKYRIELKDLGVEDK